MRSGRERGVAGDDLGQWRDVVVEGEAVEKVVPEADTEFLAGFLQAGEGIACAAAVVGASGAGDFAFDDVLADVTFAQVVMQGDVGALEDEEEFGLVVVQALQRLVEGLQGGLGAAQFIEVRFDIEFGLVVGVELVIFEVSVEVPELFTDPFELFGLDVIERQQGLEVTLGVEPAKCMLLDVELSGIVADDDEFGWEAVLDEATEEGGFGGDAPVACGGDVEGGEVVIPGSFVEQVGATFSQALSWRMREFVGLQIVHGGVVDSIVAMRPAQEFEEVDAAL